MNLFLNWPIVRVDQKESITFKIKFLKGMVIFSINRCLTALISKLSIFEKLNKPQRPQKCGFTVFNPKKDLKLTTRTKKSGQGGPNIVFPSTLFPFTLWQKYSNIFYWVWTDKLTEGPSFNYAFMIKNSISPFAHAWPSLW